MSETTTAVPETHVDDDTAAADKPYIPDDDPKYQPGAKKPDDDGAAAADEADEASGADAGEDTGEAAADDDAAAEERALQEAKMAVSRGWRPKDVDLARKLGVRPWEGKSRFPTADAYNREFENNMERVVSDNRSLHESMDEMRARLDFEAKHRERAVKAQVAQIRKDSDALMAKYADLIEEGDREGAAALLKQRDEMLGEAQELEQSAAEAPEKKAAEKAADDSGADDPNKDPAYIAWLEDNKWYADADDPRRGIANDIASRMIQNEGRSARREGRPFYDEVADRVAKAVEKLGGKPDGGKPAPRESAMNTTGSVAGGGSAAKSKKGWDDIPQEDRDEYMKSGDLLYPSKAAFVAAYHKENS